MNDIQAHVRIKTARRNAGLSVGQAAKLLNVERGRIESYECNVLCPNEVELYEMSKMYDVSYGWISCIKPFISRYAKAKVENLNIKSSEDVENLIILFSSWEK